MSGTHDVSQRLEMLVVLQWLDDGAPEDGVIAFSATTAAADLGLDPGREGVLAVMAALSLLEDRGVVRVEWPGGPSKDARLTLDPSVREDAARHFGRE
ncbi:MAG: hypothetical protein AB1416_08025 [Actinomycetota bacterium]